ncbi:hypothetical protein SAY87_005366 [Trapa incisa]|uniref:Root phototropism protein 2 n=1 Tax=Trapa incisa TaxID=236973 RepID=A0AAN7Q6X7_9MYRT|nr:hypothetical protein SAY87_005366 [Trapa incisa]
MLSQAKRCPLPFSSCKVEADRAMTSSQVTSSTISLEMERTAEWILSQGIPSDVVVQVGEASFPLHKFVLVAKSNYIRKLVMESREKDLTRIDLSNIPGGAATFKKAIEFCYGVNFEITVQNAAPLRCAAEYLQMTDHYCEDNLVGRTDDFLSQVGLSSLSSSLKVLKSCEDVLPLAEELKIVDRCIDAASLKACREAEFPSRRPTSWWMEELTLLGVASFGRIVRAMRARGAKAAALAGAIMKYTERNLRDLVRDHSGNGTRSSSPPTDPNLISRQCELLQSIVALLPSEKAAFPINFLCCLLRCAIYLKSSIGCKKELEKRIIALLEHMTVDDLLVLSFTYDGEKLFDLESVRRILSGFVEKEKSLAVFNASDLTEVCSSTMQRVAKVVDVYLGEIAIYVDLSISKFNGIANIVPKGARKMDDDLYRAVDIYLKAHPNLDELEREKVCSVLDPLKLSSEARLHASQNKRLPVQIVLHALYYDQLKLRSAPSESHNKQDSATTRSQVLADVSLIRENEELRSELTMMKMYVSDLQKSQGAKSLQRRPTFFSSMSKTLGKLNPFRQGSKDTSNIVDDSEEVKKPRRRRFSIS